MPFGFCGCSQRNMIAYVLNKEINGSTILQDIEKLIIKFKQENPLTIPILVIDIKTIASDDTSLIPKLEHKILEPDCTT